MFEIFKESNFFEQPQSPEAEAIRCNEIATKWIKEHTETWHSSVNSDNSFCNIKHPIGYDHDCMQNECAHEVYVLKGDPIPPESEPEKVECKHENRILSNPYGEYCPDCNHTIIGEEYHDSAIKRFVEKLGIDAILTKLETMQKQIDKIDIAKLKGGKITENPDGTVDIEAGEEIEDAFDVSIGDYCVFFKYSDNDFSKTWHVGYLSEIAPLPEKHKWYKCNPVLNHFGICRKISGKEGKNIIEMFAGEDYE